MPRVSYTAEQAVLKLREYDVLITQGKTQVEVCKEIGVSKDTIARWRKEFGGMQVDHAKRLKELDVEVSLPRDFDGLITERLCRYRFT